MDHEIYKSVNTLFFPTKKCTPPKSLKVRHWLNELYFVVEKKNVTKWMDMFFYQDPPFGSQISAQKGRGFWCFFWGGTIFTTLEDSGGYYVI